MKSTIQIKSRTDANVTQAIIIIVISPRSWDEVVVKVLLLLLLLLQPLLAARCQKDVKM